MKLFTTLLLLLLPLAMKGQDAHSRMFKEGRSWKFEYLVPDDEHMTEEQHLSGTYDWLHYDYVLYVAGDTVADGRSCRKIMSGGFRGTCLYALGSEENGRVEICLKEEEPAFYAPFPIGEWVTLYDFGATKGDHSQMAAFPGGDVTVVGEGVVQAGDAPCRFLALSRTDWPSWQSYAVEGIGCPNGLYTFENIITNGSSSSFVGCYDGETCIFSHEDFDKLTTVVSSVAELRISIDNPVYDLQGRRLASPPVKGIYIQDSRKMIRRK